MLRIRINLNADLAVLQIRIRDAVPFGLLDLGSGIGFFRIRDPKDLFRIPDPGVQKAPDPGSRIRNTVMYDAVLILYNFLGSLVPKINRPRNTLPLH